MALWEYKVISSGKGGFVSPALLEKFLNDLGKEDWEIIQFHPAQDNILAFTGLARRSTQRDWTLQDAAAAAAKAEAEKLRAEFEAKFKGMGANAPATAEEKPESALAEKVSPEDGFRKPIDTSSDQDPDAPEETKDEWDKLNEEDELPSFFDAIKPHMRRNQRGQGMSVGTDFLAKKWDLPEDDIKGALVECGFVLPEDEDSKPEYIEYDGDLFWVNMNRRGEFWINTKEKPRQVFRVVQGQKAVVEESVPPARNHEQPAKENQGESKPERQNGRPERPPQNQKSEPSPSRAEQAPTSAAPAQTPAPKQENGNAAKIASLSGPELLDKIRPHMRRNRRGPGGSGSTTFLARALRCNEADLMKAFAALGLQVPEKQGDKPVFTEIGEHVWWINKDQRGGVWINGREKGEDAEGDGSAETSGATFGDASAPAANAEAATAAPATPETSSPAPAQVAVPAETAHPEPTALHPQAEPQPVFAAVRLLLKETKTGSFAGEAEALAATLGKPVEDFIHTLTAVGLKVPQKPREKPVFVEQGGEIFWLNKNAKGQLWLNAKASKYPEKNGARSGGDGKKPAKRPARPKKKAE